MLLAFVWLCGPLVELETLGKDDDLYGGGESRDWRRMGRGEDDECGWISGLIKRVGSARGEEDGEERSTWWKWKLGLLLLRRELNLLRLTRVLIDPADRFCPPKPPSASFRPSSIYSPSFALHLALSISPSLLHRPRVVVQKILSIWPNSLSHSLQQSK